ncbi:hypothetical protein PEDI_17780 [Persicobacter diffluens]|uniref:Uncharacterized protein n=1 Tax=Persicobacter diffluens TaxID=981 RepID=A0AAN5AL95_9BACT|nr:hypothetical protein PEDI_17780 [Persicobacter diffluens]
MGNRLYGLKISLYLDLILELLNIDHLVWFYG